jgi:hypothetical protein
LRESNPVSKVSSFVNCSSMRTSPNIIGKQVEKQVTAGDINFFWRTIRFFMKSYSRYLSKTVFVAFQKQRTERTLDHTGEAAVVIVHCRKKVTNSMKNYTLNRIWNSFLFYGAQYNIDSRQKTSLFSTLQSRHALPQAWSPAS